MDREYLAQIPRRDAAQILAEIPAGPGYDQRVLIQLECAMNIAWWRGHYAGRDAEAKEIKEWRRFEADQYSASCKE